MLPYSVHSPVLPVSSLTDVRVVPHDQFFTCPVDALLHIPHARSTFGHDITTQFDAHFAEELTRWRSNYANELVPLVVVPLSTRRPRWLLHLRATPTQLVSLPCLTHALDAVVTAVRTHTIRSLHVYALEQYGLHGELFAEFVRAAFLGTGCTVTIFDATAPETTNAHVR